MNYIFIALLTILSLIVLFAQLKTFEINKTLKEINEELKKLREDINK
jgi:Na+/melibiose symporter-like transporter